MPGNGSGKSRLSGDHSKRGINGVSVAAMSCRCGRDRPAPPIGSRELKSRRSTRPLHPQIVDSRQCPRPRRLCLTLAGSSASLHSSGCTDTHHEDSIMDAHGQFFHGVTGSEARLARMSMCTDTSPGACRRFWTPSHSYARLPPCFRHDTVNCQARRIAPCHLSSQSDPFSCRHQAAGQGLVTCFARTNADSGPPAQAGSFTVSGHCMDGQGTTLRQSAAVTTQSSSRPPRRMLDCPRYRIVVQGGEIQDGS